MIKNYIDYYIFLCDKLKIIINHIVHKYIIKLFTIVKYLKQLSKTKNNNYNHDKSNKNSFTV